MADIKGPAERSKNMSAIRSKNTKPELYIRKELFSRGYRYRIAPSNIPGHPDIYLAKYNLAIFVHGCFWHRHTGCKYAYMPKSRVEFWDKKFSDNIRRDEEVRQLLHSRGIRTFIIWECAIKRAISKKGDPEALFQRIENMIRSDVQFREESADACL